jgi:SAM-dependent methyltransferase
MTLLTHQFGSTAFQTSAKGMLVFEVRSWFGRKFTRVRPPSNPYLQIGSGENVKVGFENLDFYPCGIKRGSPPVVGHDLRYPLPYADKSFAGAYSEHCLEHLLPNDAIRLLGDVCRVLKPGAVFRCAVPDLEKYVNFYAGKKVDAEFSKFSSGCEAIWSLTQNWGHRSVWDSAMLVAILRDAGFAEVTQVGFREGRNPDLLFDREDRRWESVYVEAVR